jgi:iron-sulfur cluster protein
METEGETVGRNTRTVNQLTDYALQQFDDYEELRSAARDSKESAIADLPTLIDRVDEAVEENGGQVHIAQSAADANRIIESIVAERDAETVVKSKSMTTEELAVNDHLEASGYEVVETDLGEFVIQLADEAPSHLIGPAIHKSPEEIATLFNSEFDLTGDHELSGDPHELTAFAREVVGEHIRGADVGMTGANFVVAETGTIMLVTNEGNARKTAVAPDTHIAVAGVEKLVPSLADLQPFTELIARTGTGQDITSYVSLLTPPVDTPVPDFEDDSFRDADERSFHLVLLDNGRMAMREDEALRETLYCIRCGACSNSCANFQAVGGHGFGGETYTGGIGTGWEAGVHGLESADEMNDLCTGCSRCEPKCPVEIDIPWINTVVRDRLNHDGTDEDDLSFLVDGLVPDEEPGGMDRQKRLFGNVETLAKLGSAAPGLTNTLVQSRVGKWVLDRGFGVDPRRDLPTFADETLREWYGARGSQVADPEREVVLYPDLYTDYFDPERGKAAIQALEALAVRVHVPPVPESGRVPLSQGMVETAREQAMAVHGALVTHLDQGRDVVVVEPSDLAMFRDDYDHLLPESSFERLADASYDVLEYVYGLLGEGADVSSLRSPADGSADLAYHSHCQQRTLGVAEYTTSVLTEVGYDVRTSDVECCGMAGSFGYKREYYEVSQSVGEYLHEDIGDVDGERLVASGTSCQAQLDTLYERPVPHPVELVAPDPRLE